MGSLQEKIQWHPAFCAAAGLELHENINELQLIPEYNLSKEPIRIDLLIRKGKNDVKIKNEIGHIMKKYNVLEYKSPHDSMTIDDFSKTLGYACLYKGYGEHVNQIPFEELTMSLFRERYPKEMISMLEQARFVVEQKYPGIYYVSGALPIAAQIVVTSQLAKETHSSLRVLSSKAEKEDIEIFLKQIEYLTEPGERNNIDAILQASVSANYDLYQEVRRNRAMCQALEELMKDVIEEKMEAGMEVGRNKTRAEDIRNIMDSLSLTMEQAMDVLKISAEDREKLLEKI